jgi:hypothetical protein
MLTVFRGMAGDAMAIEMGRHAPAAPAHAMPHSMKIQSSNATKSIANSVENTPAFAQFDVKIDLTDHHTATKPPCHDTAASTNDEAPTAGQCVACQVCHMSACTPSEPAASVGELVQAVPLQIAMPWHSAQRAASFKPPVL